MVIVATVLSSLHVTVAGTSLLPRVTVNVTSLVSTGEAKVAVNSFTLVAFKSVIPTPSVTITFTVASLKYLFFRTFARVLWLATIVTEWTS